MSDTRDFWRLLHALADELQEEGDSDYERALSLAAWLKEMPADERATCLADWEVVASVLGELANRHFDSPAASHEGKQARLSPAFLHTFPTLTQEFFPTQVAASRKLSHQCDVTASDT